MTIRTCKLKGRGICCYSNELESEGVDGVVIGEERKGEDVADQHGNFHIFGVDIKKKLGFHCRFWCVSNDWCGLFCAFFVSS